MYFPHLQDSLTFAKKCTSEDGVDALINIFNIGTFVQNKIQDAGKNTHTPITSAAMAVPTLRCTATLLIVTHFVPVNTFNHDSTALHILSVITSDKKIQLHFYPYFPGNPCCSCAILWQRLNFAHVSSKQTTHGLCFPSFDSVESFLAPRPIFTYKAKKRCGQLHSPRFVFPSVNLHISPPSLVCGLHPFFNTFARLPLTTQSTSKDLEFFFKSESMTPDLVSIERSDFSSGS